MDEKNNDILPKAVTQDDIEEINRGAKSEYKDKKRKRRITFTLFAILMGVVLFCTVIVLTVTLFFKINTITVVGNTCYDEQFLLETMGVKYGDSVFFADQKKYARNVSGVCPMIYSVRVDKNYPDEITIVITEEIPSYRFELNGIWSVVSKSGKVIFTGSNVMQFEGWDELIELYPPPVLESVRGYSIRFADSTDEKVVPLVIEAVEKSPMKGKIKSITIKSRFDIRMQYLDRFEILLGNKEDISVKLKFADKIIEKLKADDRGKINVKSAKEGFAELD